MENKIGNSLKWSTAGELLAKLIAPVTNMILARVLAPEDFGILATVNMIITFVDMFTDSGFAKYIIQCDFKKKEEVDQYVNVAFWTNLVLSVFLWTLIYIFRYPIATAVGNEGFENVIVIAATQIIVTSFSSIQTSLYRRYFDFKTLFVARVLISVIPICVTVPLALVLKNYWALVIGAIVQQLINAIYLVCKSTWKPKAYYDFRKLEKMLSFSIWSLAEAIAYWFSTWFDVFIIGSAFSAYYLGIYKNSLNTVNSIMLLVKAAVIPVLFSSLSRLKNRQSDFVFVYDGLQQAAACIVIPLSIGIYIFRDVATLILFGPQWREASNVIGVWALSSCFTVVYINFYGEALKAKGMPKILFIYEIISLLFMIPICILAKGYGFWAVVYTRGAVVLIQVVLGFLFMKKYIHFPIQNLLVNVVPSCICSLVMTVAAVLLKSFSHSILWQFICIFFCIIIYFVAFGLLFKQQFKNIIFTIKGKSPNML